MPKSKHRKRRPKRSTAPPPEQQPKPKASPKWVPYVGVGLIAVGAVVVIVTYLTGLANWPVLLGFALMGGGLLSLSQLR